MDLPMDVYIEGIKSWSSDVDGSHNLLISVGLDCEKGFGNLEITQIMKGTKVDFYIKNEFMSRDFIKRVLNALVDKAKLENEEP